MIECQTKDEISSRKVCDLPVGKVVKLEVILEPKEGLFKTNEYSLAIAVNDVKSEKIEIKVPKFSSADYISDFNMFKEFKGQFFALIVNKIEK